MNIKSKQLHFSLQFLQNKEIFWTLLFQIESKFFLIFQHKFYIKIKIDIEQSQGQ